MEEVASQRGYDVFLSFRGEDTRNNFTSHLYEALTQNDIKTYQDDKTLKIGNPIAPKLLEAIESSRFAVVILSSNFATSKWCLEEIAKIVDCMKQGKLTVIPVFYHVSPSDVRHQSNCFEQGFTNHEVDPAIAPQKVEAWRSAFKEVGAISGIHVTQDRDESQVKSKIVKQILEMRDTLPKRVDHMKKRMRHLECRSSNFKRRKDANDISNKEIPDRLPSWLDDVEKVNEDVKSISSNILGSFNVRERHQAAVKALETTEKIECLITEDLFWSDDPIPLGRVDSKPATMSATSTLPFERDTQTRFKLKSRDATFNDALKLLQQDDKTQVIALCGMGGVGKTTMMEQLKSVVVNKKMFKWIVNVVIGRNPDLKSIQHVVAVHIGEALTEMNGALRAEYLRKRFEKLSEKRENSLVILDDVWNKVELKDIGLSPLPNGVKLLLTSRYAKICREIAIDVNSIIQVVDVKVLQEVEARDFFYEITGVAELQNELYEIGGNIVKKCGGLPLAIKLIATTLKFEEESVWRDTLCCLEKNKVREDVMEVIEISYTHMNKEEKSIFLLCGMFPEDSYIPIEDLTRYAWGLKLLKDVSTLREARNRTKRCVSNLTNAYLLIDGDSDHPLIGGVTMHDLVLAFVVDKVSQSEEPWIIDHRDMSMWSEFKMSMSCKQLSLACKGGSKFPEDFKFPNLSILKLMKGDDSLRFFDDFYGEMKSLQVIAYNQMKCSLLLTSFQCSVNLQTLCLDHCSLNFDLSCIGNLSSLEVLSFANSGIRELPSTFKNLKRLRLLDLTNCYNLTTVNGVLENLDMLEELYMKVSNDKTISFTHDQCKELCVLSRKLSALDIEFHINKAQLQNMSFKKLERFRISVGCFLGDMNSYENTLKLVMNRSELHKSRLNELFVKTSVILLEVDGMNSLEDVEPRPSPRHSVFYKLRDLVIQNCVGLTYLFTMRIVIALPELESLEISSCKTMKELIHIDSDEGQKITFPKLKRLILSKLPELLCLCNKDNVIELLQLVHLDLIRLPYFDNIYPKNQLATSSMSAMRPLLNEEIVMPKLERMSIVGLDNLKEVWPCEQVNDVSSLREIKIAECDSLVNLFPYNPMPLLQHLEELEVTSCYSVEVLFNIDMDCVREVECNSKLKKIKVKDLKQLREIWRVKGVNNFDTISWFQSIETIKITVSMSFRNVITPTTSSFDMRALRKLYIYENESESESEWESESESESESEWESESESESEEEDDDDDDDDDDIYESESLQEQEHEHETREFDLDLRLQSQLYKDKSLFEPCVGSPLRSDSSSKLCSFARTSIGATLEEEGDELGDNDLNLMHKYFHHLQELRLGYCKGVEVVFEIDSREYLVATTHQQPLQVLFPYLKDLSLRNIKRMSHVWKCSNWNEFSRLQKQHHPQLSSFHNLTTIWIEMCHNIKYLFSSHMAELLSNLKELKIENCHGIEEIVSGTHDEDGEMPTASTSNQRNFLHLDYLQLNGLKNLRHIGGAAKGGSKFVGAVPWSLCQYSKDIEIKGCKALSILVPSYAATHMQKLEKLSIRECKLLEEVFETHEMNNNNSGDVATYVLPMSRPKNINNVPQLSSLRVIVISCCDLLEYVFTFSTLKSLRQLEILSIDRCDAMKEIVKLQEENGEQTSDHVVEFPCLQSVKLINLPNLLGFFLGKNDFVWKSLEEVSINDCPSMEMFTSGHSTAKNLKFIEKDKGIYSLDCGLNFRETPSSWSYHNLVRKHLYRNENVRKVIPSNELLHVKKLEKIHVWYCLMVEEIFEVAMEETNTVVEIPNLREVELRWLSHLKYIWKNMNRGRVLEFPSLTRLEIWDCSSLKHVFTTSMLGSVLQLQHLQISCSRNIEVIVKEEEEECDGGVKQIELPHLKSLILDCLESLKGFCLGEEALSFPSLDTLEIMHCKNLTVFSTGHTTTPELRKIDTGTRICDLREDLNSFVKTKLQEVYLEDVSRSRKASLIDGRVIKTKS